MLAIRWCARFIIDEQVVNPVYGCFAILSTVSSLLWHCFGHCIGRVFTLPHTTRRVIYPDSCPRSLDADRCLQSDGTPNSPSVTAVTAVTVTVTVTVL